MHTIAVHREPRDFVRELLLCHSPSNTSPESDLLIHFSLGDPLSAHCIVLAAASPFMASTLLTMEHQEEPISLLLPDFSKEEVADFLTSLYQGLSLQPFTELTSTLGLANQRRDNPSQIKKPIVCESNAELLIKGNTNVEGQAEKGTILEPRPVSKPLNGQKGVAKKKRSFVWQHFVKQDGVDSTVCVCKHCSKEVASHGGSTTAMMGHLKRFHRNLIQVAPVSTGALQLEQPDKDIPSPQLSVLKKRMSNEEPTGLKERWLCNECGEQLSSGEILVKHKHREAKHAEEWSREGRELRSRLLELAKRTSREMHFTEGEIEPNMVCKLCGTVVSKGDVGAHLATEHSNLGAGLILQGETPSSLEVLLREGDVQIEERLELERLSSKLGLLPNSKPGYLPKGKTCGDCGKEFSTRGGMRYHWRAVHSGLRPFECRDCGATFTRKDSYDSHQVMHANSKPYMCADCGKTFGRRHARNLHERAHRGDKRFTCGFCAKSFLSGHQKRSHERTHTGERPYQCSTCGRTFAQKHQMITHTRIHTGEKPYQCGKCQQWFKHLSSRRNHKCEGENTIIQTTTDSSEQVFGITIL